MPYQELHLSPHRVAISLRRGPLARLERRLLHWRSATIRFADPIPAHALVPEGAGAEEIARRLEAHWRELFGLPGRSGR
ncbi:MAG: hypothetical protein NUV94_00110 [Candidatus Acetothermia bacterium]|nr:hypothetical protein [Candidatus Acetothermia bacterium]